MGVSTVMQRPNPHYFIYNSDGICVGFNPYEEPFIEYEELEEDPND